MWGSSSYNRTYDSLFTCDYDTLSGVWDFVPKYNSETQNTLVLTCVLATSSGGNPAPVEFSALVMPKNVIDSVYVKDFFINCIGDYLIYGDERNDENIHIVNVETKKEQDFILNPKPANFKSPTISIRETKIDKETFSIKYEIFKIVADTAVIVAKTFKLKI